MNELFHIRMGKTDTGYFLLMKKEVDQRLYEADTCQQSRPKDLLVDTTNQKVWEIRWNEVRAEARGRHEWRHLLDRHLTHQDGLRSLATSFTGHLSAVALDKLEPSSLEAKEGPGVVQ